MVWVFCLNDYFSGFSYFFDVGLQMKFLVKRASMYELNFWVLAGSGLQRK